MPRFIVQNPTLDYSWNMKIFLLLPLFIALPCLADKYPDFETLAQNEVRGKDYSITVIDHASPISLFAIHGGLIETGTSELVTAIKGDFNRYYFEGMKKADNFSLHITSAKFNEKRALDLASRSKKCLSIHGYIGNGETAVCIGGQNEELAKKIALKLKSFNQDFEVLYPCQKYPGLHPENIVNKCEETGVQLEMSSGLRKKVLSDTKFKDELAQALKQALSE